MTKKDKTQMKKNPPFLADAAMPFAKPQKAPRKEEKYPPLFPQDKECYICGSQQGLERHHIFGGVANRPLSEKYGLYVSLCIVCHTRIQLYKSVTEVERLKQEAQKRFEKVYGHDKFLEVFHKNYL